MRTSVALRRHDFDPIAFIFGLLFTGSGLLFLIGRFDIFNHARWLWPGLLVLLGIAVLIGVRGRGSQAGAGTALEPRPVENAPDLDSIEPPVGPEAFRLPGWPAPRERRSEPHAGGGTEVPEPVAAPDQQEQPAGPREDAPAQRLDPHAGTEVIEEPPGKP